MYTPNGTLFGFYRALVVSSVDPEKQGRVRVRIPDIMVDKGWGTGVWCDNGIWARPGNNWIGGRNIYDTKGPRCNHQDAWYQGSCMIPPKGSHVFVFFEKGDPSHPFYFAAADYGQTKVLPENRVGPQWWNKWTPIKTRQGRTFVISDDPYDARVELTGKKRNIHNTPDGDTESVFNIDGNQSIILIDERPSHEKIFVKDYRGNYIKMIQDENGINDQLHVFFKDDIHIETLKNIYIQAHENIHITANQNIYITAIQNMHIKVIQEFREMAHLINRYSETNDNRLVEIDINDNANNTCARNAANIVRDMAGTMCSRASSGSIADGAAGNMSIMSGGTMSVLGSGGTFVDGPTVAVENGSAPIAPSTGITPATMAIKAILPTPDPDRHFNPSDDGWNPSVGDENPQYKCHNKFWKPHYNWSPKSQCDNATVTIGGGGCSGGANVPQTYEGTTSNNTSSSSQSSNNNQSSTQKSAKSINNTVSSCCGKNGGCCNQSKSNIVNETKNSVNNVKNNIVNTVNNTKDKINEISKDIQDSIDETSKQSLKNEVLSTSSQSSECKWEKINLDVSSVNEMGVDISEQLTEMYDVIKVKIEKASTVDEVVEIIAHAIEDFKENIIEATIANIKHDVIDNMAKIRQELEDNFGKYDDVTEECLEKLKKNFTVNIIDDVNDNIKDVMETSELDLTIDPINEDDIPVGEMYDQFKDNYVDGIDPESEIFDDATNDIIDNIEDQLDNFVDNVVEDKINSSLNDLVDKLPDIVNSTDPKDIIDNVLPKIEDTLNNSIDDIKDSINDDLIGTSIETVVKNIDTTLDSQIKPIEIANDLFDSVIVKDLDKSIKDGLIDSILNSSNPMDDVDVPDSHNEDLPGLPESIQQTIIDSLPDPKNILDYLENNFNDVIDDYVDDTSDVIPKIDDIMNNLSVHINKVVIETIPTLQDIIDVNDFHITYTDLCNWNKDDVSFENFIFYNIRSLSYQISIKIINVLRTIITTVIEITNLDNYDQNTQNFINNISYCITRYLNDEFVTNSLTNGIQNNINEYFEDKDITDRDKTNELINEAIKDISEFDPSEKLKENLDYDPNDDLDDLIDEKINDLESNLDDCKTNDETIPDDIMDEMEDIIKPLTDVQGYNDIVNTQLDDTLDDSPADKFNPTIPSILNNIQEDISDDLEEAIRDDVLDNVSDQIEDLKELCENKDPKDWDNDEINNANQLLDTINSYYDVLNNITEYLTDIGITEIITDNTKEDIESELPSEDKIKSDLKDSLFDTLNVLCDYIKDICKQNIVLTDNIEDNEFDRNLDLTKIYTIPGVKSSKCLCIATEDDPNSVWCDPEVIGGCGCIYEYTLFLKQKFYNPIIPIIVNDSIKTIGVSLNPILDNLTDTDYKFHDQVIINDYNKLITDIYNDIDLDLNNNKYLKRIDEFMTTCDTFGLTCIVNLLDFTYQKYKWLENIPDMEKYTHDMVDEKFIKFMCIIVNYVYFNRNKKRRSCRIILNLGNGSYTNLSDLENEKFSIYPNCGFIRELIMKLVNRCKISSNYMSITANESNNLYYYNPYSEFKCFDDNKYHELKDYEICIRDSVDNKDNGNDDSIIYNDENNIESGYAKFYTSCSEKSYPMTYMYDLMEWCNKPSGLIGSKTILEKYTMTGGEIDSNIMNVIFTPNARKVMRYFYKGHENYFKYKDLEFDPDTGDVEE